MFFNSQTYIRQIWVDESVQKCTESVQKEGDERLAVFYRSWRKVFFEEIFLVFTWLVWEMQQSSRHPIYPLLRGNTYILIELEGQESSVLQTQSYS